jgi:hypothetical protein
MMNMDFNTYKTMHARTDLTDEQEHDLARLALVHGERWEHEQAALEWLTPRERKEKKALKEHPQTVARFKHDIIFRDSRQY